MFTQLVRGMITEPSTSELLPCLYKMIIQLLHYIFNYYGNCTLIIYIIPYMYIKISIFLRNYSCWFEHDRHSSFSSLQIANIIVRFVIISLVSNNQQKIMHYFKRILYVSFTVRKCISYYCNNFLRTELYVIKWYMQHLPTFRFTPRSIYITQSLA